MKKALIGLFLLLATLVTAQHKGKHPASGLSPLAEIPQINLPTQNNEALREAELQRRGPGIAPLFAKAIDVTVQPTTDGKWERLADGSLVWRLRIHSPDAYSLNLGFSNYQMPQSGTLLLYSPDLQDIRGPYSASDNEDHSQLWSPLIIGDEVVLEVWLPESEKGQLQLELAKVNHDYMDLASALSGSCNLDVVCGEANGWSIVDSYRDIIQSVGIYTANGIGVCTGFLVNNAEEDCTPYLISGFHCNVSTGNAPSLVVYWNYENQVCRQPGSPSSGNSGSGAFDVNNSGAIYRAGYASSDMVMVELDDPVPAEANAFYAGWEVNVTPPQGRVIAIHHPSGEEKRISFENDGTYRGAWGNGGNPVPNGNHLIVADWDVGTTEIGSSGCPLFNSNKKVVGQLHGGQAACGNNAYDSFGWFYTSWTGGGTPATSLQPWLDPNNSGITSIDGRFQTACGKTLTASQKSISVCAGSSTSFTIEAGASFFIPLHLDFTGLPEGVTALAEFDPIPASSASGVQITADNTATSGVYTIYISGGNGAEAATVSVQLVIETEVPNPILLLPADGSNNVPGLVDFLWTGLRSGSSFHFQLSRNATFTDLVLNMSNQSDFMRDIALEAGTTYYWRVRGTNACGEGPWSSAASFSTSDLECEVLTAVDVPITISSSGTPQITSTIEATGTGSVAGVRVLGLDIAHSWVGDLQVWLESSAGISIDLIDRPGVPNTNIGCNGNNILADFEDDAPNSSTDLENTCSANEPVIQGSFQPIDPLQNFIGSTLAGDWTLFIQDNANDDGGILNGWGLELCRPASGDLQIEPSVDYLKTCRGATTSTVFEIGSDFNINGVDLNVANVPAGGMISFNANPANPGTSVEVMLDAGTVVPGTYWILINASDGTNASSLAVEWEVVDQPEIFNLTQPFDGVENMPRNLTLLWAASTFAGDYLVQVATDPGFNDLIVDTSTDEPLFELMNLEADQTYYWKIEARNACGTQISEETFSFTTQPSTAVSVSPVQLSACGDEQASITLEIGEGFQDLVDLTYSVNPDVNIALDFEPGPMNISPGAEVTISFTDLSMLNSDFYTFTFMASDGVTESSTSFLLELTEVPDMPTLNGPANGIVLGTPSPIFTWNGVGGVSGYTVQIATDAAFENIIGGTFIAGSLWTFPGMLNNGVYYWRVLVSNACGENESNVFQFEVATDGVEELVRSPLRLYPNPTSDRISIELPQGTQPFALWVLDVNGKTLMQRNINQLEQLISLDLGGFPSGIYLLRLSDGQQLWHAKVVLD